MLYGDYSKVDSYTYSEIQDIMLHQFFDATLVSSNHLPSINAAYNHMCILYIGQVLAKMLRLFAFIYSKYAWMRLIN